MKNTKAPRPNVDEHGCVSDSPVPGSRPMYPVRPPWARERLQVTFTMPSKTQQAAFDQTDINAIVARFDRTGILPPASRQAYYDDVSGLSGDLQELILKSRETVQKAEEFARHWKAPEAAPKSEPPTTQPPPASTPQ